MSEATAYVFSAPQSPGTETSNSLSVVLSSTSLVESNAAALSDCLAIDDELVVFAESADWSSELIQPVMAEFEKSRAKIGLIAGARSADLCFVWESLPSSLASLVMAPESRATVVLKRSQFKANPFRDVAAPLHDLIIRTSLANPDDVAVLDVETFDAPTCSASALPGKGIALPAIAPQRPGRSRHWLAEHLKSPEVRRALPTGRADCERTALLAGLWQVNDFLDESHSQSQSIEGEGSDRNGDYWHGIMHRREPDWWNSKYWFRRVGQHPCFEELGRLAEQALNECDSPVRCSGPNSA